MCRCCFVSILCSRFHSFLLHLHHIPSLIFHIRAALPLSLLWVLSSLHVCASLCCHQVHFFPIMPYIIIPTFLPIIPAVSLFAVSDSEHRHLSISPSALWKCGFSAVLLCCAPTVSTLAHLHQLCCTFFCLSLLCAYTTDLLLFLEGIIKMSIWQKMWNKKIRFACRLSFLPSFGCNLFIFCIFVVCSWRTC